MIKFIKLIVLLVLVVVTLQYVPVHNAFETFWSWVLYPVYVVEHHVVDPIQRFTMRRKLVKTLVHDYNELYKHHESLLSDHIQAVSYLDTLEKNKWLNEYQHRYDGIVCCGQVLIRLLTEENQSIILDVGSHQGVERDMVAVYKNCLVGRVIEVFPHICRVALVTDATSCVPSWCSQTKAQGIAKGTGARDSIELEYVNHLDSLIEGDLVISHGEGLIYPKGICIGFVQYWKLDGFFYRVTLKPALDLETITYCTLVSKGSSYKE